jgi:tRNA-2-methylthio-N6-dimethylallyladenosine synthase
MSKLNNKFYLFVLGCQMNQADAERIEKILLDSGWQKTDFESEAGLIIVVACSVRQSAIERVLGKAYRWRKLRQQGRLKTVLTGCVLDADKPEFGKLFDLILPISQIGQLAKVVGANESSKKLDYLCLPAMHQSDFSASVPIMNGCNNYCSYCAVPYVRGREVSRSAKSIINECRDLVRRGFKEITLLGQNVNSYQSGKYDFPKLLQAIDKIKGDYWIRFMSSHPKDLSDELIRVMAEGHHIAPHLHLALQSGDNQIIKKMNRHYTAKHYLSVVDRAQRLIPELGISTDIIVGFPSETKKQFMNTAKVMREIIFDMAFISRYSPREGTKAFLLRDDVTKKEKERRELFLDKLLKRLALLKNKKQIGLTVRVLVDGYKKGRCFGKTGNHKIVSFAGDKSLIGKFVAVKIGSVKPFSAEGDLI